MFKHARVAVVTGLVLPLVAIGTFFLSGVALAQTAPSGTQLAIKVQPALFEQVVNPGDTFSSSVTVTNPGPATQVFTVSVEDISNITGGGQPVFATSSEPEYGVSDWVTLGQSTLTIPGFGSKQAMFTITVPHDATPGGHYGAIFVTYGATRPDFTGTGIGYQVGSLIDLRVAGTADEEAAVRSFSTDKGLYQGPQVTFTTDVADLGNVILRPRGPIDITNMFGQKVGTVVMNDSGDAIFPGSDRDFTVSWTGTGFMFGRFDAVMSLTYGDDVQKTVSETTSFWIIPIIPIVAVLGSIIFFILLFIWSLRMYIKRKVKAMTNNGHAHGGKVSLSEEEKFFYENRLPLSRLVFIIIATAVFAVVFLIILFILFG